MQTPPPRRLLRLLGVVGVVAAVIHRVREPRDVVPEAPQCEVALAYNFMTSQTKSICAVVIVLVFAVLGYFGYLEYSIRFSFNSAPQAVSQFRALSSGSNTDILNSLIGNAPDVIQNSFVADVNSGVNTSVTKENAFFITHRYFDTGNNITELYQYMTSHPELADIESQAEKVYPTIFETYKTTHVASGNKQDLMYLAYLEALQKTGYADAASYSTAAAMYMTLYMLEPATSTDRALYAEKAKTFMSSAAPTINQFMTQGTTTEPYEKDDLVVALDQYAVALAQFEKNNLQYASPFTAAQISASAVAFARDNKLALYAFAALNECYILVLTNDTAAIPAVGFGSIIESFDGESLSYMQYGLTDKMINGTRYGFAPDTLYGIQTITTIANSDPILHKFLADRGYVFAS